MANAAVIVEPGRFITKSDASGKFSLLVSSENTYTITASKAGYEKATYNDVGVSRDTPTDIGELTLATASSPTVAHYLFDGDGADVSGNGYEANVNTYVAEYVDGRDDQAVSTTDISYVIDAPAAGLSYPGEGDWTVEAWIKMPELTDPDASPGTPGTAMLIGQTSYELYIDENTLEFVIVDGDNMQEFTADYPVSADEWFHVAAIYKYQDSVELYVNGILLSSIPTHMVPDFIPWDNVIIGDAYDGEVRIDEMRISAKALSPDEFLGAPFTGTVSGIVTDALTDEPLVAALVSLSRGDYSAYTNENGEFKIVHVPAGTNYTLTVGHGAYKPYTQDNIDVSAENETSVNISLNMPIGYAITAVTDIPNDQGGQVRISWNAHYSDCAGPVDSDVVSYYAVWREIDNGTQDTDSESAWDFVCQVPAIKAETYQTVVSTLADSSSANGLYLSVFKVSAHIEGMDDIYETDAASGYSIDNLSPEPVAKISMTYIEDAVELSWNPNTDEDFSHYEIYKVRAVISSSMQAPLPEQQWKRLSLTPHRKTMRSTRSPFMIIPATGLSHTMMVSMLSL